MMPLFSREKSSLKGRWRLETVQDMRSSSSNPVSCSETPIKIYGSKEEIRARKSPETVDAPGFAPDASIPVTLYGPSDRIRTCGILLPKQARYQLRYTRLFSLFIRLVVFSQIKRDTNFATPGYSLSCHDTTARGKNKVFSVCGHLCGQSRFCAAFGNRGKSSKRRCCKALRRFTMPRPGYRHGTPKPGAIPTSLYPDTIDT